MISDAEIQGIARQALRYYRASLQDNNPIVGYLHASYAVALLDTLIGLTSRDRIQKAAGLDWDTTRADVIRSQDRYETILMERTGALKSTRRQAMGQMTEKEKTTMLLAGALGAVGAVAGALVQKARGGNPLTGIAIGAVPAAVVGHLIGQSMGPQLSPIPDPVKDIDPSMASLVWRQNRWDDDMPYPENDMNAGFTSGDYLFGLSRNLF